VHTISALQQVKALIEIWKFLYAGVLVKVHFNIDWCYQYCSTNFHRKRARTGPKMPLAEAPTSTSRQSLASLWSSTFVHRISVIAGLIDLYIGDTATDRKFGQQLIPFSSSNSGPLAKSSQVSKGRVPAESEATCRSTMTSEDGS